MVLASQALTCWISCGVSRSNFPAVWHLGALGLRNTVRWGSVQLGAMSYTEEEPGCPAAKKICLDLGRDEATNKPEGEDVMECKIDKTEGNPASKVTPEVEVVPVRMKRRKFAVLLSYNGKGYMGMQK